MYKHGMEGGLAIWRILLGTSWLLLSVLFSSCSLESTEEAVKAQIDPDDPAVAYILEAGFALEDIQIWEDYFVVEGDILIPRELPVAADETGPQTEQARSEHLVSSRYRNIDVFYDSLSFTTEHRGAVRVAVDEAINDFNGAGTSLRLRRVLQRPLCNGGTFCGITIFRAPGVGSCGAAEFPNSLGHPGDRILLDEEALLPYDPNEGFNWRELITHELGHTVGLRHTNWRAVREASNSNGVPTYIPGTPTVDPSSIMNSYVGCQSGGRGLSVADKDALRALYGGGTRIDLKLYFYYPSNMPLLVGKKSNVFTLLGGRALAPVSPFFHSASLIRPVSYRIDRPFPGRISLNPTTGVISGPAPLGYGTWDRKITAVYANGQTASVDITLHHIAGIR